MAYDLEEQEQIASLKAFWSKYGNLLTWLAIIVLGSYAAYNYWNYYQRNTAAEASGLYEEMQKSLTARDNAKVQRIASDIESKYSRTAYAQMGALAAARGAFDANDLKTAKSRLQWVIDNGDAEYQSVARLRMAGVLLDEKAYGEALKVLDGDVLPQFAGAVADRKGDILVAQNKVAEARTAYQAALEKMGERDPGRQLVQLKLEAIGGTVATPKAAA